MADKYVSSNQFFIGVQRIVSLVNGKRGDVSYPRQADFSLHATG